MQFLNTAKPLKALGKLTPSMFKKKAIDKEVIQASNNQSQDSMRASCHYGILNRTAVNYNMKLFVQWMAKVFTSKGTQYVILRFLLIGCLNTIVSYFIYVACLKFLIQYQLASIIGYFFGLINSYFLNKVWKFKDSKPHSASIVTKFIAVNIFSLIINLGLLTLFVKELSFNEYISQVYAIGGSLVANFIGNKYFIFKS